MKIFTQYASFILILGSILKSTCGFSIAPHVLSDGNLAGTLPTQFRSEIKLSGVNKTTDTMDDVEDNIQLRQSTMKKKMPSHDEGGPVKPINSINEFLGAIDNAPENSLVLVQFHAKWCKVCARVIVKLRQMAQRLKKKPTDVPLSFISVEITANQDICSTLEIKKFPYIQIYRNRECVASFGTGPAHNFQRIVGGTLEEKLSMTDEQWETFRNDFKTEISSGLEQLKTLEVSCNQKNNISP